MSTSCPLPPLTWPGETCMHIRLLSRQQTDISAHTFTLNIDTNDRVFLKTKRSPLCRQHYGVRQLKDRYLPENGNASQGCCLFNLKSVKSLRLAESNRGLKRFNGGVRASHGFLASHPRKSVKRGDDNNQHRTVSSRRLGSVGLLV